MLISNRLRIDHKVAIITGASKGIGKAIARALGQQGARIVIASRKQDAVDEIAKEFLAEGIEAIGIAAHMGDRGQVKNLVEQTFKHFGGIDIIVNNAATNPTFGPISKQIILFFVKLWM